MHRKLGVRGLADEMLGEPVKGKLDRIHELVDWERLGVIVKNIHDAAEGRPAFPPLVLVKAFLLAQWYSLSDPALEEALQDRISFRRFVGLTFEDPTPDQVTLWRFRQELGKHNRHERLMEALERQLKDKRLILKAGTLLDATVVESQAATPKRENPNEKSTSPNDPDAQWVRTPKGSVFGYKAHIAVDSESGLIRRAKLTPANIYESLVADELICWDEQAVYADKAYEHKERRAKLQAHGIADHIMHRSHKNQDGLPAWQQLHNNLIAPVRKRVERVFGTLKRSYGYTQVRYYSLERNAVQLTLLAIAMNLRRVLVLTT
jgi:IS5 family transposase